MMSDVHTAFTCKVIAMWGTILQRERDGGDEEGGAAAGAGKMMQQPPIPRARGGQPKLSDATNRTDTWL